MIFLDHLLSATKGVLHSPGRRHAFDAFSHDSRQLVPGEMFVAVRGEHGDGHDYVVDAVQRGATGLLVEGRSFASFSEEMQARLLQAGVATIVVEDTRVALQRYAGAILERWHPTVIAVTGSVGKTSTKEAIAAVLASNFATFTSWQNYNDLLGLPLSLGRLEERHEYAVLEMGCDHPGEIADLCRIARPQVGILTNISAAQLQYFGTVERLAQELGTVLTCLPKEGAAIVNGDDALVRGIGTGCRASIFPFAASMVGDVQVRWEGVRCDVGVMDVADTSAVAAIHQALREGEVINRVGAINPTGTVLASHLLGAHHVATMLAAASVGRVCGLSFGDVQHALANVDPMPGRLNPLRGVHGAILLDDTHNATPASVSAGLETLRALPAGRRIAVLGDMLRLGDFEEEAHRMVGRKAVECVDYLITRGEYAAMIAEAARLAGLAASRIIVTSTHEDAARAARDLIEGVEVGSEGTREWEGQGADTSAVGGIGAINRPLRGDVIHRVPVAVLIKGSEDARMEWVTERLMAEPEEARERLVRQTPGWRQIVVMRPERPTWVEIDLSAIGNNMRQIGSIVGPRVRVLASLKADAYGHGALKVARTVLHNGASMLGVATVSEATPLREAGIGAPILVFGYVPLWQMREAVRLGLTITLYSLESALALSRAAMALSQRVKVHVKVDSGMARLGIRAEQVDEVVTLVREIRSLPGLELEGIFTHFAMADAEDTAHTRMQFARFQRVLQTLDEQQLRPPLVHAANSAAMIRFPEAHFDMVRPGIALYGLDPSTEVRLPSGFRPALSFKTQVAQVKDIPAGECISYGCTYVTERPTRVAVLPVGYADGFRRGPTHWGSVLIHGQEAPLLGRVCMDQCMVDVSHIAHTRVGDEVVLIGRQGTTTLTAEKVAQRLGTINYEVVSEILARVPRVD
jgi:Alr-MurF fusion protein